VLQQSQGMSEGLAQDEAEEYSGWRAEFVNEINYNTFEVKLTNTRSKESANFIVRPVDMVSYGPALSIETMDVHDLQTGQTESWTNDDPAPEGPIAYAISGLFYDNKQLQQKLQNIIDTHDTKGQDLMPGLDKRRSIGQEVDADAYVDSGKKTQAAMDKMKKGVAEGLNKKQEATRRIQKMLNDKFGANLDVDGVLGPLTLKSINKFMPNAKIGPAKDPNKTTAVQGKKVKNEDTDQEQLAEKWSQKYKSSINCSNPKGFSQRAHCDGKNKNEDVTETAEYNYSNINDDDWYEFNSEGNVVRQSGPRRYELPVGSNKTIKLPNGNIAAKGMTAKRLKLFKNLSESRDYYNVMCTDAKSLRQDFNMSKDRHGWFLKEGSTSKQKLDVYRAFGSPKLKEYDLSAFSGGTQTKGDDNVISPVGSQTRAQYKK
jgi:hypothetical protein